VRNKLALRQVERVIKESIARLFATLFRTRNRDLSIDIASIKSVLILRYDGVGDMILTTPFWRNLKRLNPKIRIGVVGSFRNLDVLRVDTDVDVRYDMSENSLLTTLKGILAARKERWDVVIACVSKNKTKGAIIARLCARGGLTSVLARDHVEHYRRLYSSVAFMPYGTPLTQMPDLLKGHFEQMFGVNVSQNEWHPSIMIDPHVEAETKQRIQKILRETGTTRYVHIHMSAGTPLKEWGIENSLQLSAELTSDYPDLLVLISTSPLETSVLTEALTKLHGQTRVFAFQTQDLHALFSLISHSALVVTPDTSVVHICSAEHKPIIALFLEITEWLPYEVTSKVLIPAAGMPVDTIPVELLAKSVHLLLK
jgi:ADP-heptose:LPS heptosyltransferase